MFRLRGLAIVVGCAALLPVAGRAEAQEIERGKLQSIDVEWKSLVVTVDGRERTIRVTDRTRVFDASGDTLAERLKDFRPGRELFLRTQRSDGGETALGLKLAQPGKATPGAGRNAANDIRRGTVRKLDLEARTLTLAVDGVDREFSIDERTEVRNGRGSSLAERFAPFAAGTEVLFFAVERDGRSVLGGIMTAERRGDGTRQPTSPEHSHFKPLTELGTGEYQGFAGGLYPQGKNDRPAAHDAAGRKLAAEVRPLDSEGRPSADGKVVLLSIGMSNTSQLSDGLRGWLRETEGLDPHFVFVNGAQGGMTAEAIQDPNDGRRGEQYWRVVDERLEQQGVSRRQVQAVWIKQADAGPTQGFPGYPQKLQGELKKIVQVVAERFPNARLCYLSSRTYGGFATSTLNPEPVAYESGFAVKWLIEEQLAGAADLNFDPTKGAVRAPWLSWGPYLWANGAAKRSDGFSYAPGDFADDGTHHAREGQRKVAELLLKFLQTDATTKPWFTAK